MGVYMPKIRAICFDIIGALLNVTDRRLPYQKLIENEYDAVSVRGLTNPLGPRQIVETVQPPPSEDAVRRWEADLAAECASIRLRPRVPAIWAALERAQVQIGVCSNLALPYAQPMLDALPSHPAAVVLSYRVGIMKPHKKIYQLVASRLDLKISQILFVGNDIDADLVAPAAAGATAMSTREFESSFSSWPSIYAPKQVIKLFGRIAYAKSKLGMEWER